jgi:hypothetical protein
VVRAAARVDRDRVAYKKKFCRFTATEVSDNLAVMANGLHSIGPLPYDGYTRAARHESLARVQCGR